MKLKRKIKLIIAALIFGVFIWLVIDPDYSKWHIGAICPKCLQRASIYERKIHGLTIYRSIRFENFDRLLTSIETEPNMPQVFPDLYMEIFGEQCNHVFKRGDFGSSSGNLRRVGSFLEKRHYEKRLEMIEALYAAYVNTGSKDLARKTYELIDNEFPIDDENVFRAANILKMRELTSIDDASNRYPEAAKIAHAMLEFEEIIPRLRQVKTEEQWRELLLDMYESSIEGEITTP